MTIATKLSEARLLIERGWCRHNFERNGRVCAFGAIAKVSFENPAQRNAMANLIRRAIGEHDITGWNDAQPSKQPVIEAFKRAEQLARDGAE